MGHRGESILEIERGRLPRSPLLRGGLGLLQLPDLLLDRRLGRRPIPGEEEHRAGRARSPPVDPGAKVARWQNLIPSFPLIAPDWRAWGCNPRKGRDQILQRSVAEP